VTIFPNLEKGKLQYFFKHLNLIKVLFEGAYKDAFWLFAVSEQDQLKTVCLKLCVFG